MRLNLAIRALTARSGVLLLGVMRLIRFVLNLTLRWRRVFDFGLYLFGVNLLTWRGVRGGLAMSTLLMLMLVTRALSLAMMLWSFALRGWREGLVMVRLVDDELIVATGVTVIGVGDCCCGWRGYFYGCGTVCGVSFAL